MTSRWKKFFHFALSHHWDHLENACWHVGGDWWVCARCSGLYPFLFLTLALEPFFLRHLGNEIRAGIFFASVLPAWIAWAHDRLHPRHPWPRRVATLLAIPAGFGAGLELWAHIREPFHALFVFILVLTGTASAGVWALGRFLDEEPEESHDGENEG